TTSGGGPRGNTLQSDEDRLKLDELMALCTTLQNRVLDLEKIKTTQDTTIASLKRKVKKLEKKNRSRTHRVKRLYKVGLTARMKKLPWLVRKLFLLVRKFLLVRIDAINDINVSASGEVVEEVVEVINTAKLIIDAAQVSVAGDKVSTASAATTVSITTTTTTDDHTLAQELQELKSIKPKMKGVVIQELGESTTIISS
ncbi:hypothetical protein Tco_0112671, partial [Tanacetum coccineum]